MKQALAIITASLLLAGCANGKAQRKAQIDAINAEYEQASNAVTREFDRRLQDAPPEDRQTVFDWYMSEQTRLMRDRQNKVNQVFDDWRQ